MDHDYAENSRSRNSTESEDEIHLAPRSRRRIMQLTTQNLAQLSNSDHNYVFTPVVARATDGRSLQVLIPNASIEDRNIFDEDEDEDNEEGRSEGRTSSDLFASPRHSENSAPSAVETDSTTNDSASTASRTSSNVSLATTSSRTSANSAETARTASPVLEAEVQEDAVSSPPRPLQTNSDVVNLTTPSPAKKRKRVSLEATEKSGTPKVKAKNDDADDEDDGLTCPICLDNWEMSGEHRLSSLKCGHLFGESCIRRWLQESARQSGLKVCPQCKTKAHPRDIRYLYAKRLRAIDRSEEHKMRDQLTQERARSHNLELELATTKMSYAQVTQKVKTLEADVETLKMLMRKGGAGSFNATGNLGPGRGFRNSVTYKLFMEKNIELTREPGCRVMTYADHHSALLVSQKSSQGLFPGYGLRFVDMPTLKPSNFLHTSAKLIRDISLSDDQQLCIVASMEPKAKLFDLRSLQAVTTFKPAEQNIWSCNIARKNSEYYLYLGSQHGFSYVYDIRNSDTILSEYQIKADCSPIIQVQSVPESNMFPSGGFIICKLTSLWFYENIEGAAANATRLSVEGPLISMRYDVETMSLLVQTRKARLILGKLNKIDGIPVFEMKVTFFTSTNSPFMGRSTQIAVDSNTLVAAYIQDKKLLTLYDAYSEQAIQSLPVQEVVYDTCPIYIKDLTYLAALTETKCRLYKLTTSS